MLGPYTASMDRIKLTPPSATRTKLNKQDKPRPVFRTPLGVMRLVNNDHMDEDVGVEEMARYGLEDHEIAIIKGISVDEVREKWGTAVARGRADCIYQVGRNLFQTARSGNSPMAVQAGIFFLKSKGKWKEEHEDGVKPAESDGASRRGKLARVLKLLAVSAIGEPGGGDVLGTEPGTPNPSLPIRS